MNEPRYHQGPGFFEFGHAGPGAIGWAIFALQLVIVLGVVWLVVSLLAGNLGRRATPAAAAAVGPLETLHMRYARGEIARDEYLQARADLGDPQASA
jgi:uncharacterized membrane protein